jgi:threonine/homoserine/homoserine lactone efflux protein
MLLIIFLKGLIVGLLGSIPLGPIGVLCIQRTLSKNHKSGFISGLGAASADTLFATIAFFSLSIVVSFINDNIILVKVIGGLCVMVVGVKIFLSNPAVQIRRNRAGKSKLWQDFISVFVLTLTNPAFIIVLIGIMATVGAADYTGVANGVAVITGVWIGAAIWWFALTFLVNLFRKRFRPRHLLWINRIAGAAIVLLGAITVLSMFVNIPVAV